MRKLAALALLMVGSSVYAMAAVVPEISPAAAVNALALLSGATLLIRSRRKK